MARRRLSDPPSDRSPERLLSFDETPGFGLGSFESFCDAEEYSEDEVEPLDTYFLNPGVRVYRSWSLAWERSVGSEDWWGLECSFVSSLDGSGRVVVELERESPTVETDLYCL